jgi:hypothetical protein
VTNSGGIARLPAASSKKNKIGSPDNYTCKRLPGGLPAASAAAPTNCRTQTISVKHDDETEETKTNRVCSSF